MSLKNANKVDTNRVELEIEVDADRFEAAVNDAYKKERPENEHTRIPEGQGSPPSRGKAVWHRRVLRGRGQRGLSLRFR